MRKRERDRNGERGEIKREWEGKRKGGRETEIERRE